MSDQAPSSRPATGPRLGVGWLGAIHAAGQDVDGTPIALRRLLPERLPDVGQLAQVMSFAAHHQHPHVLRVTLPQADAQGAYYVMPQAVGGSLRGVFERYRAAGMKVDVDTMLDVLRQVTDGLDFAHSRGVLHGNIKPENILLLPLPAPQQDEYRLLLSDFGLNTLRQPDPHSPYLPAPQRSGAAGTLESDLYALGAVLFEGVSGRPLPPQPLPADLVDVPEPASRVVARCLGLQDPFPDVSALAGYLKALHLSAGHTAALHLSADPSSLDVVPGDLHEIRVKVHSESARPVQVQIEGLPADWQVQPATLNLGEGQEAVVPLRLSAPRKATLRAGPHQASIVVLTTDTDPAGRPVRLEVGRLALPLRVQPFNASILHLAALSHSVRSQATVTIRLRNDGNQTQRYNLEITPPEGSNVRHGSARRQLELAPGTEFQDTLELRLPAPGLTQRPLTVTAQAHSLARPTPAESGGEDIPDTWPPTHATVQDHLQLQQLPLLPWWALALVTAGILGAGAWAARPPQIQAFSVQDGPPTLGQPFTLAWKTQGARQVRIQELQGQTLDENGEVRVGGVNEPQTYTLIARGLFTQRRQQLTVTPALPAPQVVTFKATPASARLGEKVTVTWNVQHARYVTLQPFGTVPASGSREFVLERSTSLNLRARQAEDTASKGIGSTLKIPLAPARIEAFSINPPNALRGQNVTLSWRVSGAKRVRLHPLGDLPPQGSRTIQAAQTGNYTLKASNGEQETTASAALSVRVPQAQIEALTVTPLQPVIGQPVRVQWRAQGAQRAELRWGNQTQTVAPSGDLTFTATSQTSAVTLIALNANGESAMRTQRLTLRQPAPPPSASPAPASAPSSGSVTITPPAPSVSTPSTGTNSTGTTRPAVPRPATPAPSTTTRPPASSTPAARPAQVQVFKFTPAARTPGQGTLSWRVTGVSSVRIQGLQGAGSSTTRPAIGTLRITPFRQARTLVLTAGGKRATLKIPGTAPASTAPKTTNPSPAAPTSTAGAGKATTPSPSTSGSGFKPGSPATPTPAPTTTLPRPTTSRPTTPRPTTPRPAPAATTPVNTYSGVTGTWNHSFGQLTLQVQGNRVTGNVLSTRADLPSGALRGSLSGSATNPSLNAFIGSGAERVALIVQFDTGANTFSGLYSSRQSRVPWCGWKNPAANPCP